MKRLFQYITFFVAIFTSQVAVAQTSGHDSIARSRALEYYYIQSRALLEQDKYDQSYEMLEHCLSMDPSSSAVICDLASFYLFLGKDSISQEMLLGLVDSDPSNEHYRHALLMLYEHTGDTESAIRLYERMLDVPGNKSEAYTALYSLYASKSEYAKAVEMLELLEKTEGKSDEISYQKLRQYILMSDSIKALSFVADMVAENGGDLRYMTLMGDTYYLFGNYAKAEECYKAVLAVEPDEAVTLSSMAMMYANQGADTLYFTTVERLLKSEGLDVQERVSTLVDYVLARDGQDSVYVKEFFGSMLQLPFDQVEIAECYVQYLIYKQTPAHEVIPVLEKILSLEPENSPAMLQLLVYAIEDNDYSEVIRLCDNAMMYVPELLELYYYKGISTYLMGDKAVSIDVYRQGLANRGEEATDALVSTVYSLLGDTYHEFGMLEESKLAYDSALVYNPENINVLNNYAYYLALEGVELEKALEMSRKTIVAEPDNGIYLDTYAWLLFLLERYEEAKAYAEKLISLPDDMSSVEFHHCGDIFAKCGDIDRAVEFWQKAADAGDDSRILKKKIKKRKYYRNANK